MLNGGETHATPHLLIDLDEVGKRYVALKKKLGHRVDVHYSVKANNHPGISAELTKHGCGFDVASWNEIKTLLAHGVAPARIIFSNPIKKSVDIQKAYVAGIRLFACDSVEEIDKLERHAPGSSVFVRLTVPNAGSLWPLTKKYGVSVDEAVAILLMCKNRNLVPVGVTFHVGSQCLNPKNWSVAIRESARVFELCKNAGLELLFLNLGGGLPAFGTSDEQAKFWELANVILSELDRYFDASVRAVIEPGRYLVASAGVLVTTVIGKGERQDTTWVYIDAGVYNGLFDIREGYPYQIRTDYEERKKVKYALAGPACDSIDILYEDIELPELAVGDRVYFLNAGAYTTALNRFNGFDFPKIVEFSNEKIKTPSH